MEMNERYVTLLESNIEENEWNHLITVLLLDFYFKINGWIYNSILGVKK